MQDLKASLTYGVKILEFKGVKMKKRKVLLYCNDKLKEKELVIDTSQRVDGIYYKTNLGMIPIAYLYDPKYKKEIEDIVAQLETKRKELLILENKMFSIELPKYRLINE